VSISGIHIENACKLYFFEQAFFAGFGSRGCLQRINTAPESPDGAAGPILSRR
jgi:hypothetical protein